MLTRTFARKPKLIPQSAAAKLANPGRALSEHAHPANAILHLHRTVGNRAFQQLFDPHPPATQHTSLPLNKPGDLDEQEADHLAEQVMRMPGAPHHRDASSASRLRAAVPQETHAPPILREALSSTGQPLDSAARDFMETRFGRDFGDVRLHTNPQAARSAAALDARAFTVGRHIVFAEGQFALATADGKKLIAHELAHVVQQARAGASIQRQHTPAADQHSPSHKSPQQLEELARDPGEAHLAWKKLSTEDRFAVLGKMEARYGSNFAQQFLEDEEKGKVQLGTTFYGRGIGPTPKQLIADGYRLGWNSLYSAELEAENWVHPSGKIVQRDISTWKKGEPQPETAPPEKAPPAAPSPSAKPPKAPPHTQTKEDKALELVRKMELRNNKLQDLSESNPPDWNEVRKAVVDFNEADRDLQLLIQDGLDMADVDPDFYEDVPKLEDENRDLYDIFSKLDPSFMSQPARY